MKLINWIWFGGAVVLYALMTMTVILAWFTPDLELTVLRLSIATGLLIPGWYYLLSKTAATRHWEYVKAVARKSAVNNDL